MSAPVAERAGTRTAPRPAGRTATIPAQRTSGLAPGVGPRTAGPRTTAARRAYARRDDRVRRLTGGRAARTAAPAGRAQFVLLVMVLLATALIATLWLSTAAAADSYRLQDARVAARTLTEQSERLHREVAVMQAAPALAERAGALGMIPVQDPARLVVAPDGAVQVVGEPEVVRAPAPPAPAAPPPAAPPADPAAPPADPAAAPAPPAAQAAPAGAPGSG